MYGGRRREPPLLFYLIAPMIFLVDIWVVWDSVDMVMEDSVMEDLEATADIEATVMDEVLAMAADSDTETWDFTNSMMSKFTFTQVCM